MHCPLQQSLESWELVQRSPGATQHWPLLQPANPQQATEAPVQAVKAGMQGGIAAAAVGLQVCHGWQEQPVAPPCMQGMVIS